MHIFIATVKGYNLATTNKGYNLATTNKGKLTNYD